MSLPRLDIYRLDEYGQDDGTFSRWCLDGSYFCMGVELPWNNNKRGVSCIPAGEYLAELYKSPKHGLVYQLIGVPERSNVQIHKANFGDMIDKDHDGDLEGEELEGCLAPGEAVIIMQDKKDGGKLKKGVNKSGITLDKLMAALAGAPQITVIIHPMAEGGIA